MLREGSPAIRPEVSEETLRDVCAVLLDTEPPFDIDWARPASELSEDDRLLRLARVKAILPINNAIDEKLTHDATLENYIRLALKAAGDRDTIETLLGIIEYNLSTQPVGGEELAQQVFWIWSPVAEISGLYGYKSRLDDLAFSSMFPEEDSKIRAQYDKAALEADGGPLVTMSVQINNLLSEGLAGGVSHSLSARPKGNYSVWRKLQAERRESAELFDLLGFRVIIDGDEQTAMEQCYVAMGLVANAFESERSRFKDYIVDPKDTGYQSLHLTLYTSSGLPFELQVRTRAMHNFAESDGALSHQTYDATFKDTPGKITRVYAKIPRLYQWRNEATAYIGANNGLTEGVIGSDILFFRPDGNLYRANAGINALDASFKIHSHRALRTHEISRGGRPIRLTGRVYHGDSIDVDYWPDYPTQGSIFDRYRMVVTTDQARKALERGKRELSKDKFRTLGGEVVLEMVGNIGLEDPMSLLDEKDRRELADRAGAVDFDHLLELIGFGVPGMKAARIANYILKRCGIGPVVELKPTYEKHGFLSNKELLDSIVIPTVSGKVEFCVAGCCTERVAYGDNVIARPSRIDGTFKVHLAKCNNVRDLVGAVDCIWQEPSNP
ncbi:MAG TPA: hypothetical protein VIH90_03610 [Candidatus Saccharimonadales bacterium]